MKLYMLDTDTVSLAIRGSEGVADALRSKRPSQVCISSITLAELRFGVERNPDRKKLNNAVEKFLTGLAILDFDQDAARVFGAVASKLANAGTPIGSNDTLLAAHAISVGAIFVTNNERHFRRVEGLIVENWH